MTRAYRRRKDRGRPGRVYEADLSWDDDHSHSGYSETGVDWGDDEFVLDHDRDDYGGADRYDEPDRRYRRPSRYEDDRYYEYEDERPASRYARGYDHDHDHKRDYPGGERVVVEPYNETEDEYIPYDRLNEKDHYRRGAEDKRGYLEYSEQYHQRTQQDYLASDMILPGEKYKRRTATTPDEELYMEHVARDRWSKKSGGKALPSFYKILNIFYEPFILRSFGAKLPAMQLIATLALLELFNITFDMGSVVRGDLIQISGEWMKIFTPLITSLFGVVLGIMWSFYPALRGEPKRMLKWGFIIIISIVLLFNPLLDLIFFSGWDGFFGSLLAMIIILGKVVLLLVYASPVILGVFAIWGRRYSETLIVISAVLMLAVVIASNIIDIYNTGAIRETGGGLFLYFIYAVILFIYMECSDSSIKYYRFAMDIPDDPENRDQVYFFNKTLNKYYLHLVVFVTLALILGLIVFNRTTFLGALGSKRLAESLELTTPFGLMISMIVLFAILGLALTIWRNRSVIAAPFKRIFDSLTRYRTREKELLKMEEEVRRLRVIDRHL